MKTKMIIFTRKVIIILKLNCNWSIIYNRLIKESERWNQIQKVYLGLMYSFQCCTISIHQCSKYGRIEEDRAELPVSLKPRTILISNPLPSRSPKKSYSRRWKRSRRWKDPSQGFSYFVLKLWLAQFSCRRLVPLSKVVRGSKSPRVNIIGIKS